MDQTAILTEALSDPDDSVRSEALSTFPPHLIDHDVFQVITRLALHDRNVHVRLTAIHQIERFWPDPNAVEVFRNLVMDLDIQVADAAAGVLAKIHDRTGKDLLLEAYLKAPHFGYKWLCFEALTTGWPFKEIEGFVLGHMLADRDDVIRASTVAYLARQKDSSLVADLIRLLEDKDARVRANALEALVPFKETVDRAIFEKMVTDPSHRVQCIVLGVLHDLGAPAIQTKIEPLLNHQDELFRASAVYLLRRNTGFPNRDVYLARLAGDPSPVVQRQLSLI